MMDSIREKLVELLLEAEEKAGAKRGFVAWNQDEKLAKFVADYLIANGVIVQEWISMTERLPTKEDANRFDEVLAIMKYCESTVYPYYMLVNNPENFLCWMPLPGVPKGERLYG